MTILRLHYTADAPMRVNVAHMARWTVYPGSPHINTLIFMADSSEVLVSETLAEIDAALLGEVKTVGRKNP